MVAPGLNYLWCHNSGWEQKRTILPPRSDSRRRTVPEPSHPLPGHFCHVETQLFGRLFVIFFLYNLQSSVVVFFCCCCLLVLILYVFLYSQAWQSLAVRLQRHKETNAWLPNLKKKKKDQKLFKTKEKGKCLAQVCGCCVHVPPPITNVTFQLH